MSLSVISAVLCTVQEPRRWEKLANEERDNAILPVEPAAEKCTCHSFRRRTMSRLVEIDPSLVSFGRLAGQEGRSTPPVARHIPVETALVGWISHLHSFLHRIRIRF